LENIALADSQISYDAIGWVVEEIERTSIKRQCRIVVNEFHTHLVTGSQGKLDRMSWILFVNAVGIQSISWLDDLVEWSDLLESEIPEINSVHIGQSLSRVGFQYCLVEEKKKITWPPLQ
jgi:hypothetical protein